MNNELTIKDFSEENPFNKNAIVADLISHLPEYILLVNTFIETCLKLDVMIKNTPKPIDVKDDKLSELIDQVKGMRPIMEIELQEELVEALKHYDLNISYFNALQSQVKKYANLFLTNEG